MGSLGVDVGGTFTDLVHWDGRRLRPVKTITTADQSDGVLDGARRLTGGRRTAVFMHGTTVATNALLERRGARTALVTDRGFGDVIEIGRQDRPSLYDSFADRPEPLVERAARFEITPGDRDAIEGLIAQLEEYGPAAVAVGFLYAYADPTFEAEVGERVAARLGVPLACSHRTVGEFREFERLSTTTLNAYLTPVVTHYLDRLQDRAATAGLPAAIEVMRSSGGLMAIAAASRLPAAILLSGPAGGVIAAAALGRALGRDDLVSFDMGGTSTDVCRIEQGRPEVSYERDIDGFPCRLPSVAVHTVGAGGGSVAWVDAGGGLRVGPKSAGAAPGPACYGRGGREPTVTDANLVLGRIGPDVQLAGSLGLDLAAAEAATGRLADQLGLSLVDAAVGVVEVVEAHMVRAIRAVSVERGDDPRGATLVSFGGAGGLHATALARNLDMSAVVVPPHAGVFSALGLLLSPRRADRAQSVRLTDDDHGGLADAVGEVAASARAELRSEDATERVVLDARYVGQAHETSVPLYEGDAWPDVVERFHADHEARNGFARRSDAIEVVTVRAEVTAPPALTWDQLPTIGPAGQAHRGRRPVVTAGGRVDADVWWRHGLTAGQQVTGPAVVEEDGATCYLAPGDRAVVHTSGALEITW